MDAAPGAVDGSTSFATWSTNSDDYGVVMRYEIHDPWKCMHHH